MLTAALSEGRNAAGVREWLKMCASDPEVVALADSDMFWGLAKHARGYLDPDAVPLQRRKSPDPRSLLWFVRRRNR